MKLWRIRRIFSFGLGGACLLFSLAGCGGSSHINLALLRDVTEDQPAYVGVYYLSQESVLDAASIQDLIDSPESFTDGVVDKEIFPVYPGNQKSLFQENFDPEIRWVLVVADFPGGRECTRVKRAVPAGGKLDLTITVEANCLKADA